MLQLCKCFINKNALVLLHQSCWQQTFLSEIWPVSLGFGRASFHLTVSSMKHVLCVVLEQMQIIFAANGMSIAVGPTP